jgi:hypothetical protein
VHQESITTLQCLRHYCLQHIRRTTNKVTNELVNHTIARKFSLSKISNITTIKQEDELNTRLTKELGDLIQPSQSLINHNDEGRRESNSPSQAFTP